MIFFADLEKPKVAFEAHPFNLEKSTNQNFVNKILKTIAFYVVDIFGEILIDIGSAILISSGVGAPAALAIQGAKIALQSAKDILFEYLETGKINFNFHLIGLGLRIVPFAKQIAKTKITNFLSRSIKASKLIKNYQKTKSFINFLKTSTFNKVVKSLEFSYKFLVKKNIFKSKNAIIRRLKKVRLSAFQKMINKGKFLYQVLKNPIALIAGGKNFLQAKIKKKFQAKILNLKIQRQKKILYQSQDWLKNHFLSENKKVLQTKKLLKASFDANQLFFYPNNDPINGSAWIWGLKLLSNKFYDQINAVSFILYFKSKKNSYWDATKKQFRKKKKGKNITKRPLLISLNHQKFLNFISSLSWGSFYLKNIAWGHKVSSLIKNQKDLFFENLSEIKNYFNFDISERFNLQKVKFLDQINYENLNKDIFSKRTINNKYATLRKTSQGLKISFKTELSKSKKSFATKMVRRIKR